MAVSASTQTLANYLTKGYWYGTGQSPHHFDTSGSNVITVDLAALTGAGRALARQALNAWESVADIRFREVTTGADISFDDAQSGATTAVTMSGGDTISAHVNIGTSWLNTYGTSVGSYSFQTYLHEIGHALGLGHSGDYGGGATYSDALFASDSWQQTVMSYLDQVENPVVKASKAYVLTPMTADILAIQQLYGRPHNGPTAGGTQYGVGADRGTYMDSALRSSGGSLSKNAMTIHDESGRDTVNFSDDARSQVVDLAPGSFSSVYGLKGNLGIAKGTVIENYTAGSGSDRIAGNHVGNTIRLNGGSDSANGQQGNDAIYGDTGSDRLWGSIGYDLLVGGRGNDRLDGGLGNDQLFGGRGADSFVFSEGRDTVVGFTDDQDRLVLDDALWGGRNLSVSKVLNFAHVGSGDIVFDFGSGDVLRIDNRTNIAALADDLIIV